MTSDPVTSYQGNILIVDDLPDNLRLLRDTLSKEGYKVRSATTGAMAIRAAQSPSTELILLDIKLPDLDGYEVCRQLKAVITTDAEGNIRYFNPVAEQLTGWKVDEAKGRNCVHIYRRDDSELIKQRGERQLIAQISRALETNRFCLYQQKIVSITSKPLVEHYEILIRMLDENGELVSPSAFISAAERYGLSADIDRWVIEKIFSNYNILSKQELVTKGLYTINLSGASVCNNRFMRFLIEQFPRYQIPPETICFEITETAAIANFDQARYFISELKKLGCRFALDDFGSGLSSFAYLMNLPVDYLKIDGIFVKKISHNLISQAIVEGFNRIAHAMKIETVAEFVEDETILGKLREIGVDYAQGYGISRPVPINFNS
ncbi:EAL domain-containing protein [Kamptonema sp. UHCC 0994]|uniref:EAL domain-containing response regulator n=1 Tax=Kamptonema sp. UHCC 0994 TaxID=3031329 RepID=UPI0023BAD480|nr:EAL domain-containing protein [Kamptonema sp. UHCC 0994]MDF0556747.1 EAL domain-containing protein [Kamptonema sp. UHCC 0994]